MTTCPDCENGRVEVEVGRYFDGDYKTEYQDCPTCKGSGEVTTEAEIIQDQMATIAMLEAEIKKLKAEIKRHEDMAF
jgi:DnaJ-class molecular chaperone